MPRTRSNKWPATHRVEQTQTVLDFIKNLRKKARRAGQSRDLATALLEIVRRLEADPHSFGEPLRKTKKPGGTICFAIHLNFAVHFAIFDQEEIVLIFRFETYGAFWK